MKLTVILSVFAIALSTQLPVVAQEAITTQFSTIKLPKAMQPVILNVASKRINTVKVPKSIQQTKEDHEYRITGATLQLVSLKACRQLQEGTNMATVRANIINTIVAQREDLNIKDAHRLTFIIARNAQAECGQLGSND